jgi:AcrR family transcriptional regulator
MVRRTRTAPRKEPTQKRSRATFDAIVAATARVLVKDGYDALSTNRVAREAGVSVGSLYQYFPGKEALVAAVMEQYSQRMQENIAERMSRIGADAGPEEAATEIIRAMLAAQQAEPRLHRALVEQVPRIGALRRAHELQVSYERLVAAWMESNADRVEVRDVETAAFVLVAAVEGLVNRVILDRPDLVASGRIEDHILRLILAYVNPSLAAAASAAGRLGGRARTGRD